ncbi:hypothetical protein E2C01_014970 [Portunus trituberculatus]|uniref:Uncharacterized protein n=1 Tax=Portunus trituberculatus TaxID=210409 RepID=A0A5B7DLB3_PORTR|nr:hypothetical protein [Portunus trituberculatus]
MLTGALDPSRPESVINAHNSLSKEAAMLRGSSKFKSSRALPVGRNTSGGKQGTVTHPATWGHRSPYSAPCLDCLGHYHLDLRGPLAPVLVAPECHTLEACQEPGTKRK